MTIKRLFAGVVALVLVHAAGTSRADEIGVFAAASAANALTEIADTFKARTGHSVRASFAASSSMARQIEQGAPAHIFLSADAKWMNYLEHQKLIAPGTRADLLGNSLVLVAPVDSKLGPIQIGKGTDLATLLGDGRLAAGDPDHVPAGTYARQALEALGQWAGIERRLARAESVRSALALVERGEAPLGIVYSTDAAVSRKVKVIATIPATLHDPVVYPVAVVAGKDTPAALALLDYMKSPEARQVFARYGFRVE